MSGGEGPLGEIRRTLAAITGRLDALAAAVGRAASPAEPAGALLDEPSRRRLAALESILEVGRAPAEVGAHLLAVDRAVWHAGADCAAVLARTPSGGVTVVAERGLPGAGEIAGADGIVARALAAGEPVEAGPGLGTPDPFLARHALAAAVAIPVRSATGAPIGILLAARRRPVRFDPETLALLLVLADRLAGVLGAQAQAEAGALGVARPDPLAAGEALVSASLDPARAAAVVAREAAAVLGASAVAVLVPEGAGLALAGGHGLPPEARAPRLEGRRLAESLEAGRSWFLEEGGPDESELARCLGTTPRALVPLVADGAVVALLAAGAPAPCGTALPAAAARAAALALRNARVHAEAVRGLAEAVRGLAEARAAPPPGSGTGAPPLSDVTSLLAVVLGRLAVVRDRVADPDAARELGVAEDAAWRVAGAIRRVLGFAPASAEDVPAPLDLAALVRETVGAAEGRWRAEGAGPALCLELDRLPPVRGHAEELRHALDHLLQNARESGDGHVPIAVRLRWDGGSRVEVEISDRGRGMDEATRARAGDPFFTTKGPGRLGVGLAVARAAALRHRGELELETSPGGGTTVRLRLPVGPMPGTSAPGGGRPRVLVVEDEKPVRDSLVEALELAGYTVRAVERGPAAAELLRREPVDAVVTDLALPSGSGLEVARAAKAARPGTPVILVSGWPGRVDALTLERHGIDAVIDKPMDLQALCVTLATLLGRPSPRPA
jgi:signal transduction histidine kinase/CheY-like chemotaxis protein